MKTIICSKSTSIFFDIEALVFATTAYQNTWLPLFMLSSLKTLPIVLNKLLANRKSYFYDVEFS